MSEPIPILNDTVVCISRDFALLMNSRSTKLRVFLTLPEYLVDITQLVSTDAIAKLCTKPELYRSTCSTEDLVQKLSRDLEQIVNGKTLVLNFSGGKDSCAALILLLRLTEFLNFKLRVVYVHVPYIDDERVLDFVQSVSSRLGIDIDIVEHRRRDVKGYLRWRGLPRIGDRWCTKFKIIPVKKIVREVDGYEVLATRASESPKRARSYSLKGPGILKRGRKIFLIPRLTLIDVLSIVRRHSLINPLYLSGHLRTSCAMCPYKSLYELSLGYVVEDQGFLEEVLRKEYSKHYAFVDLNEYLRYALWRYRPRAARRVYLLIKHVETLVETRHISIHDFRNLVSRFWTSCNPDLYPCIQSSPSA